MVKVINSGAFRGCKMLAKISIPDSVEEIGTSAFSSCTALEEVSFSEASNLKEIEMYAFQSCSIMKKFEIPKSVTTISMSAFSGCYMLEKIFIHSGISNIAYGAFSYCKVLTIYVEVSEQPSGWDDNWNDYGCPVVWGYAS